MLTAPLIFVDRSGDDGYAAIVAACAVSIACGRTRWAVVFSDIPRGQWFRLYGYTTLFAPLSLANPGRCLVRNGSRL